MNALLSLNFQTRNLGDKIGAPHIPAYKGKYTLNSYVEQDPLKQHSVDLLLRELAQACQGEDDRYKDNANRPPTPGKAPLTDAQTKAAKALKTPQQNCDAIMKASKALATLARLDEANRESIVAKGGIANMLRAYSHPALYGTLKKKEEVYSTVWRELSKSAPNVRQDIIVLVLDSLGLAQDKRPAMPQDPAMPQGKARKKVESMEKCVAGIWALAVLASEFSPDFNHTRDIIRKKGGRETCVAIMKDMPASPDVQSRCCDLLGCLGSGADGMQAIQAAMEKCRELQSFGAEVQSSTCRALGLSVSELQCELAQVRPGSPSKNGTSAPGIATCDCEKCKARSQGVQHILKALSAHPSAADVQAEGCTAMQILEANYADKIAESMLCLNRPHVDLFEFADSWQVAAKKKIEEWGKLRNEIGAAVPEEEFTIIDSQLGIRSLQFLYVPDQGVELGEELFPLKLIGNRRAMPAHHAAKLAVAAIRRMRGAGMRRSGSRGVGAATAMPSARELQDQARTELDAATAGNDFKTLQEALAKARQALLPKKELEEAEEALKKLLGLNAWLLQQMCAVNMQPQDAHPRKSILEEIIVGSMNNIADTGLQRQSCELLTSMADVDLLRENTAHYEHVLHIAKMVYPADEIAKYTHLRYGDGGSSQRLGSANGAGGDGATPHPPPKDLKALVTECSAAVAEKDLQKLQQLLAEARHLGAASSEIAKFDREMQRLVMEGFEREIASREAIVRAVAKLKQDVDPETHRPVWETFEHSAAVTRAVTKMLQEGSWETFENREAIVDQGGIEAIAKMMSEHKYDGDLAQRGCDLFQKLMTNTSSVSENAAETLGVELHMRLNFKIRDSIVEKGAIEGLVKSMKYFHRAPGLDGKLVAIRGEAQHVQQKALETIELLCQTRLSRDRLVACHGVEVIATTIDDFAVSLHEMLLSAFRVLHSVCLDSGSSRGRLVECGGIKTILNVMNASNDGTVRKLGCSMLRQLAAESTNHQAAIVEHRIHEVGGSEHQGLDVILATIVENPDDWIKDGKIRVSACTWLLQLLCFRSRWRLQGMIANITPRPDASRLEELELLLDSVDQIRFGCISAVKDCILPLQDVLTDGVQIASFAALHCHHGGFALGFMMVVNAVVTAAYASNRRMSSLLVSFLNVFTIGGAGVVNEALGSCRRGSMTEGLLRYKQVAGLQSAVSLVVLATSVIVSGHSPDFPRMDAGTLGLRWYGIASSLICLPLVAFDSACQSILQSQRCKHLWKQVMSCRGRCDLFAFHFFEVCGQLVLIPVALITRQELVFALLLFVWIFVRRFAGSPSFVDRVHKWISDDCGLPCFSPGFVASISGMPWLALNVTLDSERRDMKFSRFIAGIRVPTWTVAWMILGVQAFRHPECLWRIAPDVIPAAVVYSTTGMARFDREPLIATPPPTAPLLTTPLPAVLPPALPPPQCVKLLTDVSALVVLGLAAVGYFGYLYCWRLQWKNGRWFTELDFESFGPDFTSDGGYRLMYAYERLPVVSDAASPAKSSSLVLSSGENGNHPQSPQSAA